MWRTWIVIPAEAGIQSFRWLLDPRFRGGDEENTFFNGLLSIWRVPSSQDKDYRGLRGLNGFHGFGGELQMLRPLIELRVIPSISVIRGKFPRELRTLQSNQ